MGLVQEEEEKRYFIQLALQGGKQWWSSVTGYIQSQEVIPLYENFCYVLALVSSKQKENAEKGQELLHRLLQFQITHSSHFSGAFPKYIHQYPYAKDLSFQRDLMYLMQELLHSHSIALGRVIARQLKKALQKLSNYLSKQEMREESFLLEETISSKKLSMCLMPLKWSDASLLHTMLERYSCYWNPSLGCYTGPALEEHYIEGFLERSFFDYLMASYYHVYPGWLKEKSLLQLQGALVPYSHVAKEFVYGRVDGQFKNMPFSIWNTEYDSLFMFHQFSPQNQNGLHILRYLWKCGDVLHHVVCQTAHMHVESIHDDDCRALVFTYPQQMHETDNDSVELEFFVNYHPQMSWSVDTKKATVFYEKETVRLHTPERVLEFMFSVEAGAGDFMGHISRGNRPSQIDQKAFKEHEAFDWRVSLRTLRRDPTLKIKWQMKHMQALACSQIQGCLEKLPLHVNHCLHTE